MDIETETQSLERLLDSRRDYFRTMFQDVMGAVSADTIPFLSFMKHRQDEFGVAGNVAEIGVLHGLYLLLLATMRNGEERAVAIDVFDEQIFNRDESGFGAKQIVRANADRFCDRPDLVDLVEADSTSLHSAVRFRRFVDQYQEFKVFSVDGCHLKQHTVADIKFGESVLANGGLLIIDDFTNAGWAGVADGTSTFFARHNVRLAPLMIGFNKLFCTTVSHQKLYFDAIGEWSRTENFGRYYGHSKVVSLYETETWHINMFKGIF